VIDRVGASYRVLLYQSGIRFILLTNSKVLSLQQEHRNYPILVLSREPGQSPAITHKEKCKTLRATLYQESPSLPIPIEVHLLCRQDNKIPFEEVTYTEVQKALSSSSSNTAVSTS